MQTYIGLLRGINVGGHKKVPMADLRKLLGSAGLENIRTYIQSGNAVFESEKTAALLESEIEELILNEFGFKVPVIVFEKELFARVAAGYPFPTEEHTQSHIMFLGERPSEQNMQLALELCMEPERIEIGTKALYFHCPNGLTGSITDLSKVEKKLAVRTTSRNWRTVQKLLAL